MDTSPISPGSGPGSSGDKKSEACEGLRRHLKVDEQDPGVAKCLNEWLDRLTPAHAKGLLDLCRYLRPESGRPDVLKWLMGLELDAIRGLLATYNKFQKDVPLPQPHLVVDAANDNLRELHEFTQEDRCEREIRRRLLLTKGMKKHGLAVWAVILSGHCRTMPELYEFVATMAAKDLIWAEDFVTKVEDVIAEVLSEFV